MGKIEGGLFGNVSGSIGNVIFSEARGRGEKVNTVREKVDPSNPNTQAQQDQRNNFDLVLTAAQDTGKALWQSDFNRAIGSLPGFQSFMSIHLNNMNGSFDFGVPPNIDLGTLEQASSLSVATGGSNGNIDLSWTPDAEGNGEDTDELVVYALKENPTDVSDLSVFVATPTTATRVDGTYTITGLSSGTSYLVGAYFRGASGTATEGLISPIQYEVASAL